jgi:hypothetical protein
MSNRVVIIPARQAGNQYLGSLKGLQIRAQGSLKVYKGGLRMYRMYVFAEF